MMWFETTNLQQSYFHFRWAPISKQINYDRLSVNFLQTVNHLEGHHEISRKHDLFKNVQNYLSSSYTKFKA